MGKELSGRDAKFGVFNVGTNIAYMIVESFTGMSK